MHLFEPLMCFEAGLWLVDMMLMKSDFKSHLVQLALQRKIFHILSAFSRSEDVTDPTGLGTKPASAGRPPSPRTTGAETGRSEEGSA